MGIAWSLHAVGVVAQYQGEHTRGARLLGAAEALLEAIDVPLPPVERADYQVVERAVHPQRAKETHAAAWAAGRALPLHQAIAVALGEDS